MIPKTIHYCWFGNNPLPESAQKCVASWKEYFPGYEIKEWNESNYDVHKISYTSEAYNAKKYAFVSDYARFDILYQYGGIYFDVDVEVIKPFDEILEDTGFIGTEAKGSIAAGLGVGCNAGLGVVKEILDDYAKDSFVCNDRIHEYNIKTVVIRVTENFVKKGFNVRSNEIQRIAGFTIYPRDYFCPKDFATGKINITKNTYSIHHYDASWLSKEQKKLNNKIYRIYKILGVNVFSKIIVSTIFVIKHILEDGFIDSIRLYTKVIKGGKDA